MDIYLTSTDIEMMRVSYDVSIAQLSHVAHGLEDIAATLTGHAWIFVGECSSAS
jgi:hypothetical protein